MKCIGEPEPYINIEDVDTGNCQTVARRLLYGSAECYSAEEANLYKCVERKMDSKGLSIGDLMDEINKLKEDIGKLESGSGNTETKPGDEGTFKAKIFETDYNPQGYSVTIPFEGNVTAIRFPNAGSVPLPGPGYSMLFTIWIDSTNGGSIMRPHETLTSWIDFTGEGLKVTKGQKFAVQYKGKYDNSPPPENNNRALPATTEEKELGKLSLPVSKSSYLDLEFEIKLKGRSTVVNTSTPKPRN